MKKILFTLMMAGVIAFSFAPAAFAEAESEAPTEVISLNWEDFEAEIAQYEEWNGDFVTFDEIAVKMYLPSAFESVELTDEDKELGYIAYYAIDENAQIGVQYVDMNGMDLYEYADLLVNEYHVTNCAYEIINGIEALDYTNPDNENVGVIAFATEKGYVIEFSFSPITDENFQGVAAVIAASIQAAEE